MNSQLGFIVCLSLWYFCVYNYSICINDNFVFSFLMLIFLIPFSIFGFVCLFCMAGTAKAMWNMLNSDKDSCYQKTLSFPLSNLSLSPSISLSLSIFLSLSPLCDFHLNKA